MAERPAPALTIAGMMRFSDLLLRLQAVRRTVRVPGRGDYENDVEHSYQLALMAWYVNDVGDLGLDVDRVIRYALVHDLAEAHTGDVFVLDHEGRRGKRERELAALDQIDGDLPEFRALTDAVREYDRQADPESQFVYALDKLMPMVMIYLEGGTSWREMAVSRDELLINKTKKTAACPPVQQLWLALEVLIRERPELFIQP